MDDELYYATSQAAAEWGVSQQRVVDLCKAGLIECETTHGGHYRIAGRIVQKYKATGLPRLPRRLPQPNENDRYRYRSQPYPQHTRHDLLAPPSTNLVASREQRLISDHEKIISENEVTIARNRADKRQAEWEQLQVQDHFDQRDQAKADQAAELERKQERHAWMKKWIKCAVDSMPDGARGDYEPAIVKAAREELAAMDPRDDDEIVQSVIAARLNKVLGPWYEKEEKRRWKEDIAAAVDAGVDSLPALLKSWYGQEPSEAEIAVREMGSDAIVKLSDETGRQRLSRREMTDVAIKAAQQYVASLKAAKDDQEMRERVKSHARAYWIPWGLTRELHTIFVEAIDNFVNIQPRLSEPDLKAAVKKEVTALTETLERGRRLAAASAKPNMDAVSEATSQPQLKGPSDAVVPPTVPRSGTSQERRRAAERRIDPLLDACVAKAVAKEERDGLELDGPADRMNFCSEIKDAIRPGLVNRWATVTNLPAVSDETLDREIRQAARAYIMEVVPEER